MHSNEGSVIFNLHMTKLRHAHLSNLSKVVDVELSKGRTQKLK